jgi:hypothetical protein
LLLVVFGVQTHLSWTLFLIISDLLILTPLSNLTSKLIYSLLLLAFLVLSQVSLASDSTSVDFSSDNILYCIVTNYSLKLIIHEFWRHSDFNIFIVEIQKNFLKQDLPRILF